MNAIQKHNFDNAKHEIESFSQKVPSSVDLPTVATDGGLFNLFKHKVDGTELNEVTEQIQKYFINTNSFLIDTIRKFGEVYKALEALDKDYIQGIILGVKAAEKASEQAKDSSVKAEANSRDIKVIIEAQKRTINSLVQFQNKIEKYEHLKNIDEIWGNYKKTEEEMKIFKRSIENQTKNLSKTSSSIDELNNSVKKQITQINGYIGKLESAISEQEQQSNDKLDKIEAVIKEHIIQTGNSIRKVEDSFRNQIEQLNGIINILEISIGEKITQACNSINELKSIIEEQTIQINEYKEDLNNSRVIHEEQINHLSQKMKLSYILAGSSIGITLLTVVLNVLGVL